MSRIRSILSNSAKWLQNYHELEMDLTKFEHPADKESFYQKHEQQIKQVFLGLVGEEDHSPMYFAELYEGQARDAENARGGRNKYIAELRKKVEEL